MPSIGHNIGVLFCLVTLKPDTVELWAEDTFWCDAGGLGQD